MSKKILVVGGGGREHAIIKALKKSPDCGEIWCAPGNGGIRYDAKCKNIKATDVDTMVGFAVEEKFDYVVVAQDDPLALGMVDGQLPDEENVTVYHSGTALTEDGQLVTNGGRVLGVTATGPRLTNALSHAYEAAEKIHFDKLHKRSDIGLRALKALAEKQ